MWNDTVSRERSLSNSLKYCIYGGDNDYPSSGSIDVNTRRSIGHQMTISYMQRRTARNYSV